MMWPTMHCTELPLSAAGLTVNVFRTLHSLAVGSLGLFMNTLLPCLLLPPALLAGCSHSPQNERVDGSGYFTLTNGTGTVFWGHLQDSKTNNLQFVLLLPETAQVGPGGGQTRGDGSYDYFNLKTKRDGHQWRIEANGNLNTGTESLRLYDLTAHTATNIDLDRSRLWQISNDKILTPLDKIDPTIIERVLHESESGFERIQSLRKKT
jgi:hypothetical protein